VLEEFIILTNIIFITIILTADNAVIVGSLASNFVSKNRKQIIEGTKNLNININNLVVDLIF
tara:strand:+ start:196 stop:381 length:186 start_codon:yes stop_codon:yes gene_type:complete